MLEPWHWLISGIRRWTDCSRFFQMTVVCENSSDANSGEVPQFEDENTKEIDETETLVAELAEKLANKKLLRQENIDAPR